MGSDGADCFHSFSTKSRELNKEDWDKLRFGMICTKADNFANWKASIEKLCADNPGRCTQEASDNSNAFINRINRYKKKAKQSYVNN